MTGLNYKTMLAAAFAALGLMFVSTAKAQQQVPGQVLQQFGPRAKQPSGGQAAAAAVAQQPRRPQAEVVATHGDWSLTCGSNPRTEGGDNKQNCAMIQSTQSKDREGVGLTMMLIPAEKDGKPHTMIRVMAPIGVFLPTGVALEIDGAAVGRVPFTRCLPRTCMAFAEASEPTLEKLKKGAKANFIIYEDPGKGMALEISLKGFTAGLRELHKL